MLFKRKISPGELIALLLDIRAKVEERTIAAAKETFGYEGEEEALVLEARIFSLWVLTVCLPPGNKRLRDAFHLSFCKQLRLDNGGTQFFLKEIATRYRVYNQAFAKWQEKPSQGSLLGACILKIVRDHDIEAVSDGKLPVVGAIEAIEAVSHFMDVFKKTMEAIGNIKRMFKTQELEAQS